MQSKSGAKKTIILLLLLCGVSTAGLVIFVKMMSPASRGRGAPSEDVVQVFREESSAAERDENRLVPVKAGTGSRFVASREEKTAASSEDQQFRDYMGKLKKARDMDVEGLGSGFPAAQSSVEKETSDEQSLEQDQRGRKRPLRSKSRPAKKGPRRYGALDEAAEDEATSAEADSGFGLKGSSLAVVEGKTARARPDGQKEEVAIDLHGDKVRVKTQRWTGKTPPPIEDLKQRTSVATQEGNFMLAEKAAGVQDTVYWGKRSSKLVIPDESPGVDLQGQGVPDFSPDDPTIQDYPVGTFFGWVFDWRPILIERSGALTTRTEVENKWKAWMANLEQKYGHLYLIDEDIDKLIKDWRADVKGWRKIMSVVMGGIFDLTHGCLSFYSDVDITLSHPKYGDIRLDQCLTGTPGWGAPPPYVLSKCRFMHEEQNKFDGFETAIPDLYRTNIMALPDVLWRPDWKKLGRPPVMSFPSTYYRRDITDEPGGSPVAPNNPQNIIRIEQHLGYGVVRLQYGFCVDCKKNDHPSFWPSVYFNMYRNFDGSDGADKRCLPASAPNRKAMVNCTRWGNCVLEAKCNTQELRRLRRHDAKFRDLAENNPHLPTEQVCDMFYGITNKITACLASGGKSWPGGLPSSCK